MRDITLGQYINSGSVLHKLDPRLKLVLTLCFLVVLFFFQTLQAMAAVAVAVILLYKAARIPLKLLRKNFKAIMPIVLFTSLLNMFFVDGDVLFSFWKIAVTRQGVYFADDALAAYCAAVGRQLAAYLYHYANRAYRRH